ncbi:6-pyruvoyl trahydropterin synthase family protein [Aquisalimonas asiatica]|uniref:6-carboxy-5,6,7,8-tetrahydropterin synthase n=1 Tax=Aquisalimonas asiatica TaxID=406100 RepID=A0A1H8QV90_9GAMM|nr:6-carboxytetrahydropterin synthase [Aquisalimonas asiatica]SEO58179.1 6-pyruvoyl tetrahydropterin synthase [Aquisalimonas asiatica]
MARLFVEQLTVIDSSRLDPVDGLVGESWIVDVEIGGSLDAQGMVFDFGDVKRELKAAIDDTVDHRLLVPEQGTGITHTEDGVAVAFASRRGPIHMSGPAHTVVVVPGARVDAAALERLLQASLLPRLPGNVTDLTVHLRHEAIDGAWYAYSHGLQAHGGACQRIAHGHRSRLIVQRDGEPARDWEQYWARRWRNVYLGTRDHLVTTTERDGVSCYGFRYTSGEGVFTLELPAAACELLETETTVEQIAAHLHGEMKDREPAVRITVRAFEGVGKGALADG